MKLKSIMRKPQGLAEQWQLDQKQSLRCQVFLADPQINQFCEQVARDGRVFTLETPAGLPVFAPNRIEVIPFWSSRRRAQSAQRTMRDYALYSIREESREEFCETTIPWLEEQNILMGINWNGENPLRYVVTAQDLLAGVQAGIEAHEFPIDFSETGLSLGRLGTAGCGGQPFPEPRRHHERWVVE